MIFQKFYSAFGALKNHQIFMPKTDWVEWRSLVQLGKVSKYLPKSHFSTTSLPKQVKFAKFSQRIETGMIDLKRMTQIKNQFEYQP